VALAGQVLASHYADPVERRLKSGTALRSAPSEEAEELGRLTPGAPFMVVEDSVGWAWGYAGEDRRVGYVRSNALSSAQS
jgi:hypothetical protein